MEDRLAIAIGSRLRRDDAVAYCLSDRLRGLGFRVLETTELTLDLALDVSRSSLCLFLDAAPAEAAGLAPLGPARDPAPAFSHSLTPEEVAACARSLYHWRGAAWNCLVGAVDFGEGEGLSAEAVAHADQAFGWIEKAFRP
jgi:Ni,Fe-hydrogenase maturation factor